MVLRNWVKSVVGKSLCFCIGNPFVLRVFHSVTQKNKLINFACTVIKDRGLGQSFQKFVL